MAWEKFQYARTNTVLKAQLVLLDEYAEFADLDSLPNSERQKVYDIQAAIQSIARLGRSAHIHVIIATQSSTGNLFPEIEPEPLKANLADFYDDVAMWPALAKEWLKSMNLL